MVSPAKLKLVTKDEFQRSSKTLWDPSAPTQPHSLFSLIYHPNSTNPDFCQYFIDKYSSKGDIILDPFCGAGNIPLAAALQGRVPYCSDIDPFALCLTAAKLQPVDITAVTLMMQQANLKAPVSLSSSMKDFLEIYELETLREVLNLRKFLLNSYEPVARFIEVIALSLLHGNNTGYFSVYTNPHLSLLPEEQKQLNIQRKQKPEYRAVLPRILKKTATVTVDGIPSSIEKSSEMAVLKVQDARDLSYIKEFGVDLIFTSLPLPANTVSSKHFWLKHWFSDIDVSNYFDQIKAYQDINSWCGFVNESLIEFARVLPPERYIVLHIKDILNGTEIVDLTQTVLDLVETDLHNFWHAVECVTNSVPNTQLRNALKERASSNRALQDHFIVLKRR